MFYNREEIKLYQRETWAVGIFIYVAFFLVKISILFFLALYTRLIKFWPFKIIYIKIITCDLKFVHYID